MVSSDSDESNFELVAECRPVYGAGPGDGKGSSHGSKVRPWLTGNKGKSAAGGGCDSIDNFARKKLLY